MSGASDYQAARKTAEALTMPPRPAEQDTAQPGRGKPYGRMRVLTLADAANAPTRAYLLHGLLATGEFSLWWGPPKCGKSFFLLRLGFGLALGLDAWGRRAKHCRVLYVAAEGEGGFAGRILALQSELGEPGDAFQYIAQRAELGPPGGDLEDVAAAAKAMRADLIVIDTLARTFGQGDENAARDMGGFVANVDRLREETGAHVAVIHHGRKDGGDARGSGALAGAADLIVKVERGGEGQPNRAEVMAAKDDVDGTVLPFRLRVVELGSDSDGEPRRTCIAEEAEGGTRRGPSLPRTARTARAMLEDVINKRGADLPRTPDYPTSAFRGAKESDWRAECEARRLSTSDDPKNRARTFRQAFQQLRDAGLVAVRDEWVWVVRREDEDLAPS